VNRPDDMEKERTLGGKNKKGNELSELGPGTHRRYLVEGKQVKKRRGDKGASFKNGLSLGDGRIRKNHIRTKKGEKKGLHEKR